MEKSAEAGFFCAKIVKNDNYFAYVKKSSKFGLRHYVSPEFTVAKSCKWQNKMNFICTFGFFVVNLRENVCKEIETRKQSNTEI